MKKLILAASLLTVFSTPVFARQINLRAVCSVNRSQATCEVYNHLNFPVYCYARAVGVTRYGFNANFAAQGVIYPGQSMYVNVYAHNPYNDPLVRANAKATCSF